MNDQLWALTFSIMLAICVLAKAIFWLLCRFKVLREFFARVDAWLDK